MKTLYIVLVLFILSLPFSTMEEKFIPPQVIVKAQESIHSENLKFIGVIGSSYSLPKVLYVAIPILLISLLLIFVNRKM